MTYPIKITRKSIKNLYLRIQPDGSVSVSAPKRMPEKAIWNFIDSKSDWIEEQRAKMLERQENFPVARNFTYITGEIHYLWGKPYTLHVGTTIGRSRVYVDNRAETERICLQIPKEFADNTVSAVSARQKLLNEFYRVQLKETIPSLMDKYITITGKAPAEWRIRDMKTRWGSCNVVDKRIWLSLNLAKKDVRCLEYVIAHELTHLYVANHSKEFWAYMDRFYPDWRAVRKLLNER